MYFALKIRLDEYIGIVFTSKILAENCSSTHKFNAENCINKGVLIF